MIRKVKRVPRVPVLNPSAMRRRARRGALGLNPAFPFPGPSPYRLPMPRTSTGWSRRLSQTAGVTMTRSSERRTLFAMRWPWASLIYPGTLVILMRRPVLGSDVCLCWRQMHQ